MDYFSDFQLLDIAIMFKNIASALCLASLALAHGDHDVQTPIQGPHQGLWYTAFDNIPGDGGTQVGQLTSQKSRSCFSCQRCLRQILSSQESPLLGVYRISHV